MNDITRLSGLSDCGPPDFAVPLSPAKSVALEALVGGSAMAKIVQDIQASNAAINALRPGKALADILNAQRTEVSLGKLVRDLVGKSTAHNLPKLFEEGIFSKVDPLGDLRIKAFQFGDVGTHVRLAFAHDWQPSFGALRAMGEVVEQMRAGSQSMVSELTALMRERAARLSELALIRTLALDQDEEDMGELLDETEVQIEDNEGGQILYETPQTFDRSILGSRFNILLLAEFRKNPEKIRGMKPREFEEFVAEIFHRRGFEVKLTPETRDGGYDILAVRHGELTGKEVHLVECKRNAASNKVEVGIVRSLLGVIQNERATKGIIVTTSRFTRPAREFAQNHQNQIALHDFAALKGWLASLKQ